jgi:glycosyltransferase involved in cell wall biosynthesis
LDDILKKYSRHPEIVLITSDLSMKEIRFLHSLSDCFISLSRGDGFLLDAYDAYKLGKFVITTKFGGQPEYLPENHGGYVSHNLVYVPANEFRYGIEQQWSDANLSDASSHLKDFALSTCIKNTSPHVLLSNGWNILESVNGTKFRHISKRTTLNMKTNTFSHLKLTFMPTFAETSITVVWDSSIRKHMVLTRESPNLTIPIQNSKVIELLDTTIDDEYDRVGILDHRPISKLAVSNISLIKNSNIIKVDIDGIDIENECTFFSNLHGNLQKRVVNSEDNKVCLVEMKIKQPAELYGILYFGQYGTCGYASAAKGNLCHFFQNNIAVSWHPLYFDNSQMSDDCFYNAMVKSLINKPIPKYDTVIFHTTPDVWPDLIKRQYHLIRGKRRIGYTVWETDRLPANWVKIINESVDEVWCPSQYNKCVFESSGVKVNVKVFPHKFLNKKLPNPNEVYLNVYGETVAMDESDQYTFYNISELTPRKGIEDLIETYCNTFVSADKVRLLLKVHYRNYSDINKKYCIDKLNSIVSRYANPPKIRYLLDNMSESQILGLHSIGDCYVSLCKSEGFGLPIFEANNYGKDIITTGYGGPIDFLTAVHPGLVKYTLGSVKEMSAFSPLYTNEQRWAYPDLEHAGKLMKKMSTNYI